MVEDCYLKVGDQRREWYDIKYWFQRFQLGEARLQVLKEQVTNLVFQLVIES